MYEATYRIETDAQLTEAQLLQVFKAALVSFCFSFHDTPWIMLT